MKRNLLLTIMLTIAGMLWSMATVRAQGQNQPDGYGYATAQLQDEGYEDVSATDLAADMPFPERLQTASGSVRIVAPARLLQRAMALAGGAEKQDTAEADDTEEIQDQVKAKGGRSVGYRVQVYADNNVRSAKEEARRRERALEQAFPEYATYVSYASPYWRLRVGDFRSQYEAEKAAADIRKLFPRYAREVRVVRDKVNVR